MKRIPRQEHPRPDRMREDWLTLCGEWDFEIDNECVGKEEKYYLRDSLNGKIILPFSPESQLSGVGNTDFMNAVWYRRSIDLPREWQDKRIILHIDASDYFTTVYVNGREVGSHRGGYTSFSFDITDYLNDAGNYISICAEDDIQSGLQLSGKQSKKAESYGCFYTRTTGIWQSVWLEAVCPAHVIGYRAVSDISTPSVSLAVSVSPEALGCELSVIALYEGKEVGRAKSTVESTSVNLSLPLAERHLWECGKGRLYDLTFTLNGEGACDVLHGYFGLREVSLTKKNGLTVNGKTVFGRFVLDQGFYPDGIITAPSDDALVFDIKAAMSCGFNGARLHQKVFEPRFLYHADRLGYMVYAECGNWGLDHTADLAIYHFLPEWLEEMERDFSHPCIIGWCPTNETWDIDGRAQSCRFLDTVYDVTKAVDPTRHVITSSGSLPTQRTDVHDVHDYEQDPEKFASYYSEIDKGIIRDQLYRMYPQRQIAKTHLPIFISEYGGIKWVMGEDAAAWGYGDSVKTEEEFFARLEGLTDAILENGQIFAFCYTQLTDVEQEQNGLLTYDRRFKFPPERYARIFGKKAKIEK